METRLLLCANLKRHKSTLLGIGILMFLTSAVLGSVLTVWQNSDGYIFSELERIGYGDLTAWVSELDDIQPLAEEMESLPEIKSVETQAVIFSNYEANNMESDSEGQLILYDHSQNRYRFFTDNLSGYQLAPESIPTGHIYISPSLQSMMGLSIGDSITFPIARSGRNKVFTVAGFYEDPIMGSSMIGMKGFLIGKSDFTEIQGILAASGIDTLARNGWMLHISASDKNMTTAVLNQSLNEKTQLPQFVEFTYGLQTIHGFMMILQNAFSAILLSFTLVLFLVVLVVLGNSIRAGLEADRVNMGILKTVGFTGSHLRQVQLLQYLLPIAVGMILGLASAVPLSRVVADATLTTTGIRIPTNLAFNLCLTASAGIVLVLVLFLWAKTRQIKQLAPLQTLRGKSEHAVLSTVHTPLMAGRLEFSLAIRQIFSGWQRYLGLLIIAMLLTFFAALVGRIDSWLGADGKGMMDAFNPADHDIGVQIFGDPTIEQAEAIIRGFSEITETYDLAMPDVAVNGMDYTANVITSPERFHILEGRSSQNTNEVVLTEFVAADLGVSIGDTVTVTGNTGSAEFTVVGIYSCANDMGNTIGMNRESYLKIGSDAPNLWCHHYFLADPSQKEAISTALETAFGGDVHVHENTWPGLFGILAAMQVLLVVLYIFVAMFILIVTVLTTKKLLSAEQKDIGIYKAIGFSTFQLRRSFALRFGASAFSGATGGLILSGYFTDTLVSHTMKLAGISNFASYATPTDTLLPLFAVTLLFFASAYLAAGKIRTVGISVLISE